MSDFSDQKYFERWAGSKPDEWHHILAVRSALRAIPLLSGLSKAPSGITAIRRRMIMLPAFRAALLAWVSAKYPKITDDENYINAKRTLVDELSRAYVASHAARGTARRSRAVIAASNTIFAIRAIYPAPLNTCTNAASAIAAATADTAAEASIWEALSADASFLEANGDASRLSDRRLWPKSNRIGPIAENFNRKRAWPSLMRSLLRIDGEDWQVWADWYDARVQGRSPWSEEVEVACALIPDEIWKQGPAVVNAEIRRIREGGKKEQEREPAAEPEPAPEPELELGPEFELTEEGLSIKPAGPPGGVFDEIEQRKLHERLKRIAQALAEVTKRVSNERPAMNSVVSEYAELVSQPFEELDVAILWSVGAGLLANALAFDPDRAKNSSRGPLEPDHFALLNQAAEVHSGFILGFPKGRELADRADQSRITPEVMQGVVENARGILRVLRDAPSLVSAKARKFLGALEDSFIESSWRRTRTAYATFAATKNALIAILKENSFASTMGGTLLINSAAPLIAQAGLELSSWTFFVLQNRTEILAFAAPFLELRLWVAARINAILSDQR